MEEDPRKEIEQEAEERREQDDGFVAETAGDAAADGLIGPNQPGGPSPGPDVELEETGQPPRAVAPYAESDRPVLRPPKEEDDDDAA